MPYGLIREPRPKKADLAEFQLKFRELSRRGLQGQPELADGKNTTAALKCQSPSAKSGKQALFKKVLPKWGPGGSQKLAETRRPPAT